jgi:hypothetical protein
VTAVSTKTLVEPKKVVSDEDRDFELEDLEEAMGPSIRLARVKLSRAIWNPEPNPLRGQTIESVRESDPIDCDWFPRCGVMIVRGKSRKQRPVVVPFPSQAEYGVFK